MAEHDGIRTKVTVGVITGVILTVLGYLGRAWWPTVWRGIAWFFGVVWAWLFSGHSIYGWLLVILILCTVICGFVLLAAFFQRTPQHNWRSYRRDIFFGIVWRWDYFGERIGDPIPYCRHCDTQLIPREDYDYGPGERALVTQYICDHCHGTNDKHNEPFQHTQNKVIRQIDRKLRNDEWKKALPNAA